MKNDAYQGQRPTVLVACRMRTWVVLWFMGLLALGVLPACGLFGGGVSEEEFQTVLNNLSTTRLELNAAISQISSEKQKAAGTQRAFDEYKAAAEATALEGRISLEVARLRVIKYAQENLEVYGTEYSQVDLVWVVETATEDEEFYYVTLTYRPLEDFEGTPGKEEFITDKTGKIEFRQVLDKPLPETKPQEPQ